MKQKLTNLGGRVLLVFLISNLLALFAGGGLVAAQDANPVRELPATVMPGDEFEVTVTFTSPHADFHAIGLTDVAPPGWNVSVDTAWATPSPMDAYTPAPEEAVYIWAGPYPAGVEFTAVYKVQVPVDAELESYTFSGSLEYYIEPHPAPSHQEEISGDVQVVVVEIGPTLELCEGVNIISYTGATASLPEALTNIGPDGLDVVEIVWARGYWTGGQWLTFYFYHGFPLGEITELENGRAYVVVVTEACTWELPH